MKKLIKKIVSSKITKNYVIYGFKKLKIDVNKILEMSWNNNRNIVVNHLSLPYTIKRDDETDDETHGKIVF